MTYKRKRLKIRKPNRALLKVLPFLQFVQEPMTARQIAKRMNEEPARLIKACTELALLGFLKSKRVDVRSKEQPSPACQLTFIWKDEDA